MVFAPSRKNKKEKIRRRTKRGKFKQFFQQNRKLATVGLYLGGFVVLVLLLVVLGRTTLFASKYTIRQVSYDPESIAVYDNPFIYQAISDAFSGKNYFMTKRFGKSELHEQVQEEYPLVSSIRFNQQTGSTVYAHVEFHHPTLVFNIPPDRKVAAYASNLYSLVSGNLLGEGSPVVNLPLYTSGMENLYGILHKYPETTLLQWIQTIENTLGKEHIQDMIYLPGGEKLFVTYKSKLVYFHLTKDINQQLAKLVDLETYYDNFGNVRTIDLGSVDDIIVR